ncbi:MAG: hypothetical protein ACLFV8_12685 [Alphaproteobacteria bacterium]
MDTRTELELMRIGHYVEHRRLPGGRYRVYRLAPTYGVKPIPQITIGRMTPEEARALVARHHAAVRRLQADFWRKLEQ